MKILTPRSFVFFGLAALSGVVLLHTSQNVQQAENRVEALQESIAVEEDRIRMLKAEWAHLNRPERLEKLAQEFLDLSPPEIEAMPKYLASDYPDIPSEAYPDEDFQVDLGAPDHVMQGQPVSYTDPVSAATPVAPPPVPAKKPVTREQKKDFSDVLKGLEATP